MDDVEAALGPPPHEVIGVDLGSAGIGVVEIAPCQDVDAFDTGPADLVDGFGEISRHGGIVPSRFGSGYALAVPEPVDRDTVVVTGASGWLGRALLAHLLTLESRPRIVAGVRGADEAALLRRDLGEDLDIVDSDLTAPGGAARLFAGLDGRIDLVHTAGVIHPRRVADFDRVNVGGTRAVIDAARDHGVGRFVHISSNSPFGVNPTRRDLFGEHEPYHPYLGYGESKMRAERLVLEAAAAGLDAVILRPPWFYGPWQPPRQTTFFRLVRTGRFPIIGDGHQQRSMVYVDNLVGGVMAALDAPDVAGRAYWIADERPYEIAEIVSTVKRVLAEEGYTVAARQLRIPGVVGVGAERADRLLQAAGIYHQQIHVLGELRHTIAARIDAARRDLGYRPTIGLEAGMRASVRWCRERGIGL